MNLFSINKLSFLHCGPIDLEIKSVEIIGLSGVSGSGKSRFLRALIDLDEHEGEVRLDEVRQLAIAGHAWRKKVALLAAETSWWFDTVGEHFSGVSENQFQSGVLALGLSKEIPGWSIARLSSGEKQRLGLLRLLQNRPAVLLLDEPTANLDKHSTRLFETLVKEYLVSASACAIWVSHDIEQLAGLCQRRYELHQGVLRVC